MNIMIGGWQEAREVCNFHSAELEKGSPEAVAFSLRFGRWVGASRFRDGKVGQGGGNTFLSEEIACEKSQMPLRRCWRDWKILLSHRQIFTGLVNLGLWVSLQVLNGKTNFQKQLALFLKHVNASDCLSLGVDSSS